MVGDAHTGEVSGGYTGGSEAILNHGLGIAPYLLRTVLYLPSRGEVLSVFFLLVIYRNRMQDYISVNLR